VDADPLCVAATSPDGEINLGNTTSTTGATNLQLAGVADDGVVSPLIQPEGGALVSEPVNVPGGLLGLMCPSDILLGSALCETITNSDLNRVTASVAMAGELSDFSTTAGLFQGRPIVTLPGKVNLDHPLLDPNCSIGSEVDPIILRPSNTVRPTGASARADLIGTPNPQGVLTRIPTSGHRPVDPQARVAEEVVGEEEAFAASEPAFARMCIVEVLASGPDAIKRRNDTMQAFAALIHSKAEELLEGKIPPRLTAETMVGGIYEVVYTRVLRGEIQGLPRLLPDLIYSSLLPYMGVEAAREARERLPEAQAA
jgi:hypothetical protein